MLYGGVFVHLYVRCDEPGANLLFSARAKKRLNLSSKGEGKGKVIVMTHPIWQRTWRSTGLHLLLLADLFFIGLHLLHFWLLYKTSYTGFLLGDGFRVDKDGSFAEYFQYLKLFSVTGLLVFLWARRKGLVYGAWGAVFAFSGLDDALRIHEDMGGRLVHVLGIHEAFGLRGQDFGELLVWGSFGVILLGFVLFATLRAGAEERAFSKNLALLFMVFVFFGLGVDMLHILLKGPAVLQILMPVLEDGGEMLTISVLTTFVWTWLVSREAVHPALSGRGRGPDYGGLHKH